MEKLAARTIPTMFTAGIRASSFIPKVFPNPVVPIGRPGFFTYKGPIFRLAFRVSFFYLPEQSWLDNHPRNSVRPGL